MASIITVILVIALSMLVTKIASIALMHTGMNREQARFQARSAFTGAGFTTVESEQVVRHPVRRRVIMLLILFGNAGLATAIASLIIGFSAPDSGLTRLENLGVLAGGIFVLFLTTRSRLFDRALTRLINHLLDRFAGIRTRPLARLMQIMGDYEVAELTTENHQWLCHQTLADLKLRDEGVLVLGILRPDGTYLGVPRGPYRVEAGDRLVVYGESDRIEELSQREHGTSARTEHEEATEEQQEQEAQEAQRERATRRDEQDDDARESKGDEPRPDDATESDADDRRRDESTTDENKKRA